MGAGKWDQFSNHIIAMSCFPSVIGESLICALWSLKMIKVPFHLVHETLQSLVTYTLNLMHCILHSFIEKVNDKSCGSPILNFKVISLQLWPLTPALWSNEGYPFGQFDSGKIVATKKTTFPRQMFIDLTTFRRLFPQNCFMCILGWINLLTLPKWKQITLRVYYIVWWDPIF